MRYVSTRGDAPDLGFADVLLGGLAPDGGLYVPERWPTLAPAHGRTYVERAVEVMLPFVEPDIDEITLAHLCEQAYATFRHDAVVPLVQIDADHWVQELFHGPTLAFKDVALQLVGRMFDHVLAARGERVTIVGATSGDTGSAAITFSHLGHSEFATSIAIGPPRVFPWRTPPRTRMASASNFIRAPRPTPSRRRARSALMS